MEMEIRKEVRNIYHSFQDFDIKDELGRGGFAIVYKATYHGKSRCFGEFVAIKEIDKTNKSWRKHERFVRDEIKIHKDSYHPNIVKLYHHLEDEDRIWLILELCGEGSVEDYMKERHGNPFNEGNAYKIFKQVVDGVMYLHSKHIIHRDLTLRNILLTNNMQVKIADFGLSTKLQEPDDKKFTVVGTPKYMPPEIMKNKGHSDKADCWNLGCILYALLVEGKPPKYVNKKVHYPNHLSPEAKELLMALLEEDPHQRTCIEAVPDFKFFKKYEKSSKPKSASYRSEDSGNGSIKYRSASKEKESRLRSRDSSFNSKNSAQIRSRKNSHSMEKLTERPNFDLLPSQKNAFFSDGIHMHSRERSASKDRKPYILLSCNNLSQQHRNYTNGTYRNNTRDYYKSQEGSKNNDSGINSSWKTHYSVNPNPIEHFDDPSCRFNNSIIERRHKVCPSSCSHVGYCDNKCSHIGSCWCHSHSSHKSHLSSSNKPKKFSEHNLEQISALNAARLKPKRHWIEKQNTVVHISADSQVIMEFLKTKRGKVYVSEVFTISTDGMKIRMYNPPKNTLLDDDLPPPFPNDPKEIKCYSYPNFPYGKEYWIAKKFVDTLRAKTPKLINNGENAKFYMMENTPDPDCRMAFYDGSCVIKKGKDISVTDKHGRKLVVSDRDMESNPMLLEFECERENCERILKFHESLESPNFPVVIGMAKDDINCSGKENFPPTVSMTNKHNRRSENR